jgi:type I restriction enzyme S subunit
VSTNLPFENLPNHWKMEKLDHIFRVIKEPARLDDPPVSAFIDGVVTLRSNRPEAIIKASGQEIGYKHIEVNDLVISGMNAHLGGLGISDSSGKCTPVYTILRKSVDLHERYISYYLWHAAQSGYIKSLVNAVRYNSADFGPETVKRFMVPLPPIEEQRRIADYLDEQVSRIDKLIGLREIQVESFWASVRSRFSELFLVVAHAQIRLKRLLEDEKLGIWGEEQGENPLDVYVARVADFDRKTFTLGPTETIRSIEPHQFASRRVSKGDILLERSGGGAKSPVGCAVYVEEDLPNLVSSNFVSRIRVASGVNARYLSLLFAALYANGYQTPHSSQTTGIQNLDTESYFQIKVPLLPESQQIERMRAGESLIQSTDGIVKKFEVSIALLKEYKSSLITAAVTGQFDVTARRSVA